MSLLGLLHSQLPPHPPPEGQSPSGLKSSISARRPGASTAHPASLSLELCPASRCVAQASHPSPAYSERDVQSTCTTWKLLRDVELALLWSC